MTNPKYMGTTALNGVSQIFVCVLEMPKLDHCYPLLLLFFLKKSSLGNNYAEYSFSKKIMKIPYN